MEAERWRRIDELFRRALAAEPDARAALLACECGADHELRARVERMLADDEGEGDVFDAVERGAPDAPGAASDRRPDPRIGTQVGAYRIVERIAVGGMGVVYRAARTDGSFEQDVAVKLIRAERATDGMIRRFERERRTLAALEHPSIARLLDGGTTADGLPFLVMELVRGVPIDRYCDDARLSVAARVKLFAQVCQAVHFAHRRLIVHRDLKPSNVLIDEHGAPKLLDFGIAWLLADEQSEPSGATATLTRILTPEYASPEQLAGGPVTTAIDVYALGVILYEVLTGQRPFRFGSGSLADWERVVAEHAPPRPSTIVVHPTEAGVTFDPHAFALRRDTTPHLLQRRLRGDLDRIVLMALRKEPERRYSSARELADDLERYLAGRPVLARGDSLAYRASKFVRRNRLAVLSAVAVTAALVGALVATRASERHAREMTRRALVEADSFEGIAEFLRETFLTATIAQDASRVEMARESVRAHAERVRRQYGELDPIRANLLDALGRVCVRLDAFEDAERLIAEALELRDRIYGARSAEHARSLRSLGQLDFGRGEYGRAAGSLEEALALQRELAPDDLAEAASLENDLAACLRHTGREDEAERLHEDALARRRVLDGESLPVAESLNNLAGIDFDRGDFERAERRLREADEIRSAILGERHPLALQTRANLASALWQLGRRAESRALLERTEAGYRALGADGEAGLGGTLSSLAWMEYIDGGLEAAERHLDEALELQAARLGAEHPVVAELLGKLALVRHGRGRDEEARELWERVLAIYRATPDAARELANALYTYAVLLWELGEYAATVPLLEEAIAGMQSLAIVDPLLAGRAESLLSRSLARTGRRGEALEHLRVAGMLLERSGRATPGELELVREGLAKLAGDGHGAEQQ